MRSASVREVMVCLDGSELGESAVPHARAVARALGARLTLLRVLEANGATGALADPVDWGIRQREARAQLERVAARIGDLEPTVRSELIQGRPAEQICSWAEHHGVDLTVVCSHGAHGVSEWDLASTARKLVDRIPGSVLLVPAAEARAGEAQYRRILVPLDGSPRAESVVPIAMRIAALEKAELVFAHVVPAPQITRAGPLDAEGAELERRVIEHNHRVACAYLDRLRGRVSQTGVRVRSVVVRDEGVRARLGRLIREERADLVVMSAQGHTGRADSACGSVADYALTHAAVPLLVVRDRERRRMRRVTPTTSRSLERPEPPSHASP